MQGPMSSFTQHKSCENRTARGETPLAEFDPTTFKRSRELFGLVGEGELSFFVQDERANKTIRTAGSGDVNPNG
jgi:hypothetical protein